LRLPCIREIAVILADVRDDQQLDEVERGAGGEQRVLEAGPDRALLCSFHGYGALLVLSLGERGTARL
jgi:hypothetical protein